MQKLIYFNVNFEAMQVSKKFMNKMIKIKQKQNNNG